MTEPTEDQIAGFLIDTLRKIEEYGWTIIAVFPTADEPDQVEFAYTVGLSAMSLPEVIVAGLPPNVAHSVLNNVAAGMIDRPYDVDDEYDGVLAGGYKVRFREASSDLLSVARKLYPVVGVLQLLWPDKEGHFPTDPDYDPTLREFQPLL